MVKRPKAAQGSVNTITCTEILIGPADSQDKESVTSSDPQYTPTESSIEGNHPDDTEMAEVNGPETSPYTTPVITLSVGPGLAKYAIQESFLSQCPELAGRKSLSNSLIELPEVSEDIGHTLVHYLYTGTYQTLKLQDVSQEAERIAEYKRSTCVYFLAKKFGLQGLELLAEHRIGSCEGEISIFDVLDVTEEVLQQLSGNRICLPAFTDYLKKELKAALSRDEDLFTTEAFLDRIGINKSFNKALVKCIVEIYTEKIKSTARYTECAAEEVPSRQVSPPADLEPATTAMVEEYVVTGKVEAPACIEESACVEEPIHMREVACAEESTYAAEPVYAEEPAPMDELACVEEPIPMEVVPCLEVPNYAEETCPIEEAVCAEGPAYAEEPPCLVEPACSEKPGRIDFPWWRKSIAFLRVPIPRNAESIRAEPTPATPIDDLLPDRDESLPDYLPSEDDIIMPKKVKKYGKSKGRLECFPDDPAELLGSRPKEKPKGKKGNRNLIAPDIDDETQLSPIAAEPKPHVVSWSPEVVSVVHTKRTKKANKRKTGTKVVKATSPKSGPEASLAPTPISISDRTLFSPLSTPMADSDVRPSRTHAAKVTSIDDIHLATHPTVSSWLIEEVIPHSRKGKKKAIYRDIPQSPVPPMSEIDLGLLHTEPAEVKTRDGLESVLPDPLTVDNRTNPKRDKKGTKEESKKKKSRGEKSKMEEIKMEKSKKEKSNERSKKESKPKVVSNDPLRK